MDSNQNIFLTLGKYTLRQKENLLTQGLCALYNNSPAFQQEFYNLLNFYSTKTISKTSKLQAQTQKYEKYSKGRIIVDLELIDETERPAFVIEAKLDSILPQSQIDNYSDYLKKRSKRAILVLVTCDGVDSKLYSRLPKRTIWITWSQIGEACSICKGNTIDRFLNKGFNNMLKENDITILAPVSSKCWQKIQLFNKFVTRGSNGNLHFDGIDTLKNIMARMTVFSDAAWKSLSSEGYKPYCRAYKYYPGKKEDYSPYASLDVGYWHKGKNRIQSNFLGIEFDCRDSSMTVYAGWLPSKKHPDYSNSTNYKELMTLTSKKTIKLFNKSSSEVLNDIKPLLIRTLSQFRKTKYYTMK